MSLAAIPNGAVVTGISGGGSVCGIVTLKCIATVNLAAKLTNGMVFVSWPVSHTGWSLQMQTNALNANFSSNWVEVIGSTLTNAVALPTSSTTSTFFRLAYPY
jgi:hypothetical protein